LGNTRAANYEVIVRKMIRTYGKMGVNMSLKIHLLDAHVECFPENCDAFNDELGERFHQEMHPRRSDSKGKT